MSDSSTPYDIPDYLSAIQLAEKRSRSVFLHHRRFRTTWMNAVTQGLDQVKNETVFVDYNPNTVIRFCADLSEIIEAIDEKLDEENILEDNANRKEICRKVFEDKAEEFPLLEINTTPVDGFWYNKTIKGINLRPGLINGSTKFPSAVTMKGEDSHAVIVGRTGSGKSVFLNNLILNLILEYAPWELTLYLADFKKVEMSRYMTSYPTPHVKACAATSEIRYVLSLISHIKKLKDDRETLFARLGLQKIEDFRELYPDIIMPRILLIVDEFQQMFLDATGKQSDEIGELLTDITRKGRATGVHLLFASQEMKGTGIQLTNFKLRFALPCDADVSSSILGNSAASTLEQFHVIVNAKSGKIEDNVTYRVPYAPDDDSDSNGGIEKNLSYFTTIRKKVYDEAIRAGYVFLPNQKFYRENEQKKIEKLSELLNNEKVKAKRIELVNKSNKQYFLSLVLGRSVVYNRWEYDIENILIENGKNRCFLGVSNNNIDLAYMQKLLAVNIATLKVTIPDVERQAIALNSDVEFLMEKKHFMHYVYELNPIISEMHHIEDEFKGDDYNVCFVSNRVDEVSEAIATYNLRRNRIQLLQSGCSVSQYCIRSEQLLYATEGYKSEFQDPLFDELISIVKQYDTDIQSIPELCKRIAKAVESGTGNDYYEDVRENLSDYYRYHVLHEVPQNLFSLSFVWISGLENIESVKKEFSDFAKNCMDVNMYCMFFSLGKAKSEINSLCDYIIVGGLDNELYNFYIGYTTARNSDSITLECKVKSLSKVFAFKKYRVPFSNNYVTSIDFDRVLSGN